MAYVSNGNDEEEQQNANGVSPSGGGSAVHLAPSSGVGAVGNGAGTGNNGQQAGGGSFATINQYLNANQGNAEPLAGQITSGINQQFNALSGQNDQVTSDLNNQVNSGYTAENQGLLSQEAANPTDFAGNASNVSGFQGQLNDKYTGPQSAETNNAFTGQQAKLNTAISNGQASTQTEAGREGLLQGIEKTPTNGVTALNSAILSQDPNATSSIENAYQPFQGLVSGLTASGQQIDQNIAGAQTAAAKTASDANNQLQGQVTGLNNTVGGKQSALSDQFNGYNSQVGQVGQQATTANSAIQNYLSNTPQVTADTSALNPYLNLQTLSGPAPTNATSADAGDYKLQGALQTLAGSNNPLNTVIDQSTASQAGTALPSNFAQLQQSLNGLPAAENTALGNVSGGLGTASAPALQSAQQIQNFKDYETAAKALPAQITLTGGNGKQMTVNPTAANVQQLIAQDQSAVTNAPRNGQAGAKAKLATDQKLLTQVNQIGAMPGAQNDTTAQKQQDASTIGGGQWINGADTGFNSLLGTLGSSLSPIAVNSLPTAAQVTPNTSDSGFGGFGNIGNILATVANPTTLNPVTLGLDKQAAKQVKGLI